jgi:glycosyltransferase involved in cell wall biosynthesis
MDLPKPLMAAERSTFRPPATTARVRDMAPVLVLADHLGYQGGIAHGVTSYFLQVLPALRAAGVDLTLCLLREPHAAAEPLRELGIQPIFLRASKWNPLVPLDVAAVARHCGARLLHVTGLKGSLAGRAAARLVDAAVIVHTHDLNEPGPVVRPLQRWLARPGDVGVCVSEATRELTIRGYHVAPERTEVIHNGIRVQDITDLPVSARAQVRTELGIDAHRLVIGMVGRLHPVKGHRAMLEMMPAVVSECPRALLLVIGDGPERGACETRVDQLQLREHVRFLGQRKDVPSLLAAVDVAVMPSSSEGLGLAAIEALAAGRPVVGFAVGGLCEVIQDRISGRLVPAGDRTAFVAALLETLQDERRRLSYGARAAADAAARFSVESHVHRLIDCYRRALADHAARPNPSATARVSR